MLELAVETEPGISLFPQLVEGDIRLSFNASTSGAGLLSATSSSNSGGGGGTDSGEGFPGDRNGEGGVVWTVQALPTAIVKKWTIFPSTRLLLPGKSWVERQTSNVVVTLQP